MNRMRWFFVMGVGMLCVAAMIVSMREMAADVPTISQLQSQPVIIIDPGHGGINYTMERKWEETYGMAVFMR